MKKFIFALGGISLFLMLNGCGNMPTPPSQITGSYVSPVRYENYTCNELAIEMSGLARRENQLITAQEQRIKISKVQAFWRGYGEGDGIEASELANVRGEKEAVRAALDKKGCDIDVNSLSTSVFSAP